MSNTTTIRVSRSTQELLTELAIKRGATISDTVARASRLLEQELIGTELSEPLRGDELEWLNADAG